MRIRVEVVGGEEVDRVADFLRSWVDVEVLQGLDETRGALEQVLVDSRPVVAQLVLSIAVLVDDLHLFDDGRLAALTGAWRRRKRGE